MTQPADRVRPVLYVEDHPVNVLLMQALFEHRPQFELMVAGSGEQALRLALGLKPALLLLDRWLPDCSGERLLALLRRVRGLENVPAVAVTADSTFEIAGTDFLEVWRKPLDLGHVLARVDALTSDDPTPALVTSAVHAAWGRRRIASRAPLLAGAGFAD